MINRCLLSLGVAIGVGALVAPGCLAGADGADRAEGAAEEAVGKSQQALRPRSQDPGQDPDEADDGASRDFRRENPSRHDSLRRPEGEEAWLSESQLSEQQVHTPYQPKPKAQAPFCVVRRADGGSCQDVQSTGGYWSGCPVAPGLSNGFCTYGWISQGAKPPVSGCANLSNVAKVDARGNRSILLDECAQSAGCGMENSAQESSSCRPEGSGKIDGMPSCDVCSFGFIENSRLYATIDADYLSNRYEVKSGNRTWPVSAPADRQIFTALLPGAPNSTNVTIQRAP